MIEKCPYCDAENDGDNPFCEHCGTLMHILVPYEPKEEDYVSPPQASNQYFQLYLPSPAPSVQVPAGRVFFYFIVALPIALGGMFGLFAAFSSSTRVIALSLCCMLALTYASIVLFYRTRKRGWRLSRSGFVMGVLVITTAGFLLFCLEVALLPEMTQSGHALVSTRITCGLILSYGLALEVLALQ
jgi:hypothetical protein